MGPEHERPGRPEKIEFRLEAVDLPTAQEASARSLCDHCLGRLYAARGRGYTNRERGAIVRNAAGGIPEVLASECKLCDGLFGRLDFSVNLILAKTAEWEHTTYLVGTKVDEDKEQGEEALWSALQLSGESIRKELNREIGKRYGVRADKEVDLKAPDIAILLDTRFDSVELTVNPLFISGRYRKLSREIPQTRWPCPTCQGRGSGCTRCGGTGKLYSTSVEELVGGPLLAATGGEDHRFHGMGREDIDARMLGRGRPFIIEAIHPRRRNLDPGGLEREMNARAEGRIEVSGLKTSNSAEVVALGAGRPEKSYQVSVRCADGLLGVEEALVTLAGGDIDQRTPVRVSHRRADLVRRRAILSAQLVSMTEDSREAVINIRAAAGTYIKELVHGDDGRTSPSLAGLLARPVQVVALDVLEVHDDE